MGYTQYARGHAMRLILFVLLLTCAASPLLVLASPVPGGLGDGGSGRGVSPDHAPRRQKQFTAPNGPSNSRESMARILDKVRSSTRFQESYYGEEGNADGEGEEELSEDGATETERQLEGPQGASTDENSTGYGAESSINTGSGDFQEPSGVHPVDPQGGASDSSDEADANNTELISAQGLESNGAVRTAMHSGVPQELREVSASGGEFRGVPGGVVDGVNITHLSYMMFKLIKQHGITSVVDMPCRNTLHWFPSLLHILDFEVAGFKYYCVDSENNSQDDLRHLFGDAGSPELMYISPEQSTQIPKADLLFTWNGPQQWGVRRTWAFLNGIREVRPQYLLITNNPGASNADGTSQLLNIRKQPFHFAEAKRVLSHMEVEGEPPKQLLLYEVDGIRKGF